MMIQRLRVARRRPANQESELRLLYATAANRFHVSRGLDRMAHATGLSRDILKREAIGLGITRGSRRPWTAEDIAHLEEKLGKVPIYRIARQLHRSRDSVKCEARRLRLSRQIREGYSMTDLQEVFGVRREKVRRWMDLGLLGKVHNDSGRVAESSVIRFVRAGREYDIRRVDQSWFESIVFDRQPEDGN